MKNHHFSLIILVFFLFGCESIPQSVKDLGRDVATSQKIISRSHTQALDAYSISINRLKTDITKLVDVIEKNRNAKLVNNKDTLDSVIASKTSEALTSFDLQVKTKTFDLFDNKLEDIYWPNIKKKVEALEKEAEEQKKLRDDNECHASPAENCEGLILKKYKEAQKLYRGFSLAREQLLHKSYVGESQHRKYLLTKYIEHRAKFKQMVALRLTKFQITNSEQANSFEENLAKINSQLDATISSIVRNKTEMTDAFAIEEEAIEQINSYLNRPKVWELVLKGVSSEVKNTVGSYSTVLQDKISGTLDKSIDSISEKIKDLDLSSLIDEEVNKLSNSIDKSLKES